MKRKKMKTEEEILKKGTQGHRIKEYPFSNEVFPPPVNSKEVRGVTPSLRGKIPQTLPSMGGEKSPVTENHYKTLFCLDFAVAFPLSNPMSLPSLEKILLHNTSKTILTRKGRVLPAWAALSSLTGQRGKLLFSKKSVAAFKVRQGNLLGCKVDLRGEKLYNFLDKFIYETLPREMGRQMSYTQATPLSTEGVNREKGVPFRRGKGSTVGVKERFSFLDLEGGYQLFESIKGFDVNLVPFIPLCQIKSIVTPSRSNLFRENSSPSILLSRRSLPSVKEEKVYPPLYGGWSFIRSFRKENGKPDPSAGSHLSRGIEPEKGRSSPSPLPIKRLLLSREVISPLFSSRNPRGTSIKGKTGGVTLLGVAGSRTGEKESGAIVKLPFLEKGTRGLPLIGSEVYTSRRREGIVRENPSRPLQYWILLNSFQFPSL